MSKGTHVAKKALVLTLAATCLGLFLCLCGCYEKVDPANVFDEISNDNFACFSDSEGASYTGGVFPDPDDFGVKLGALEDDDRRSSWVMRVERRDDESIIRFYLKEYYGATSVGEFVTVSYVATYSTKLKRLSLIEPEIVRGPFDENYDIYWAETNSPRGSEDVPFEEAADILAAFGVSAESVEERRLSFVGAFVSAYLDESDGQSAYSEEDWGDYELVIL